MSVCKLTMFIYLFCGPSMILTVVAGLRAWVGAGL
jgi:hypothetical protein